MMADSSKPVEPTPKYYAVKENYLPGEYLGEGSYGVTVECTHRKSSKNYACKTISKRKLDTKERRERMQNEKKILLAINSLHDPNLISTKEVLEDDYHHYIIMELCQGGTLWDRLSTYGPFTEKQAAITIKQIVKALDVCHKNGIVHRDMKLDNVMYETKTRSSNLRLIDFGLATYYEEGKPLMSPCGSLMSMAPEMLNESGYGPKVDMWGVGVILFMLLIGKCMPWRFKRPKQMRKFFSRDFATFQMFPYPNLSEGARDLLRCMLTIDVNDRWSASQVLEHPWINHMENST